MTEPPDSSDDVLGESLASAIAKALRTVQLTDEQREAMRRRVLAEVSDPAPAGTVTLRANESEWVKLCDLIRVKLLRKDLKRGDQTVLLELLPGASYPAHPHTLEEETLVLEGEILIGSHRLSRGDMHVAAPGSRHDAIVSERGALCLVRSEFSPEDLAIA